MSRVHDALRRAQQEMVPVAPALTPATPVALQELPPSVGFPLNGTSVVPVIGGIQVTPDEQSQFIGLLERIPSIPYTPSPDNIIIDPARPHEAPTEEFRTLRTRLNHLQTLQPIRNVVITSPSPAEGKSFTAVNLAIAESQLEHNRTIICDYDFRRPIVHNFFQIPRSPGITNYLLGTATLDEVIKKIEGTNLYVMPAGDAVINPLELLNLRGVRVLLDQLPKLFNWVILDSPPLLFAADASLLSTLSDGTIIVVRIGSTTIDSVTRAINSLCNNNVIGTVVNGARRGELYSKYTYYHSYYYEQPEQ